MGKYVPQWFLPRSLRWTGDAGFWLLSGGITMARHVMRYDRRVFCDLTVECAAKRHLTGCLRVTTLDT